MICWRFQTLIKTPESATWCVVQIESERHVTLFTFFQRLLRLPLATDWERFDYYARRIRRLGISRFMERNNDLNISCEAIFDLLNNYRTSSPPNVWYCHLNFTRLIHDSRIYRLSLGPALTSLQAFYEESSFIDLCSGI